jgi:hypothetical protein
MGPAQRMDNPVVRSQVMRIHVVSRRFVPYFGTDLSIGPSDFFCDGWDCSGRRCRYALRVRAKTDLVSFPQAILLFSLVCFDG